MAKKKKAKKKKTGNTLPPNGTGGTPAAPGTYFLSLTVQNIRCFGDETQTLDLSDGNGRPARWTILFGENGTGKTTLLQVLAGFEIRTSSRTSEPTSPAIGVFEEAVSSEQGQSNTPSSREVKPQPRAVEWIFTHKGFFSRIGAKSQADMSIKTASGYSLAQAKELNLGDSVRSRVLGGGTILEWDSDASLKNLRCYGFGAGRRLRSGSLAANAADDPTASLISDDAQLRNAEEWLLQLDYSASKESKFQARQQRRLGQIKELLRGVLQVEDLRFTVPEGVRPIPFVEFKTADGWIPLRQLGHGYRTTAAWVVDLASRLVERDPDNDDPLAQPAVVLVDEIDLHMHPKWQRHLMQDLSARFPNAQFVVTAHSPLIAQAAEDANLVLLRREGDRVVIENKMPFLHGWRVDQVLTSDLFGLPSSRPPQLDGLLRRRGEILTKAKLTEADKKELARLEAEIGDLPGGETAAETKMLALLREALDRLQRSENGPP